MAARTTKTNEPTRKSFGSLTKAEPFELDINGETYLAYSADSVPAFTLLAYQQQVTEGNLLEAHQELFAKVLTEESAKLFLDKLSTPGDAISLPVMIEVAEYLINIYSDTK